VLFCSHFNKFHIEIARGLGVNPAARVKAEGVDVRILGRDEGVHFLRRDLDQPVSGTVDHEEGAHP
jgi:hypothetical protein